MILLILLSTFTSQAQDIIDLKPSASQIKDFKNLKLQKPQSFYCNCNVINEKFYSKKCSYNFGKHSSLDIINYIIPLSQFTSNIADNICKNKDYKCLQNNKYFRDLIKDPNNIYYVEPTIAEKIGHQKHSYFKKNEKQSRLDACPIFFNTQKFFINTPRAGWYARLKLYLNDQYPAMKIITTDTEVKELTLISKNFKPTEDECTFSNKIAKNLEYKNVFSITACSNKKGEKK